MAGLLDPETVQCSANSYLPEPSERRREGWYARKRACLEHLASANEDGLLVSVCDMLHNARAIRADLARLGPAVFDRFNTGRGGVPSNNRELAQRFAARRRPVAGELDREVGEIGRLAAG